MKKHEGKMTGKGHISFKGFMCAFFMLLTVGSLFSDSMSVQAEEPGEISCPTGDRFEPRIPKGNGKIEQISEEEYYGLVEKTSKKIVKNANINEDDYYYNQLDDNDKMFYNAFLQLMRENKGAAPEAKAEYVADYGFPVFEEVTEPMNIDWASVYTALEFDHPEELELIVYDIDCVLVTIENDGQKRYSCFAIFIKGQGTDYSGAQIAQMEAKTQTACNAFFNKLNLTGDAFNKELIIHDAIMEKMEYNYDALNHRYPNHVCHTSYGAFVELLPVCDGYAKALKMLLNKAGIECHIVAGLGNGGGHAWNIVKLGNDYYEVDVTWDDNSARNGRIYGYMIGHDYFNRTTDNFTKHVTDIPGYASGRTTTHIRDQRYYGYLNPAIANGEEFSYSNIKQVYKVTFYKVKDEATFNMKAAPAAFTYEGKIQDMPTNARLEGYTFEGWFTEKDGGTPITKDTIITKESKAYANWKPVSVCVNFYADSSNVPVQTVYADFGSTYGDVMKKIKQPEYEQGDFTGWFTGYDTDVKIDPDAVINTTEEINLYGQWVKVEYTLTYNANDGKFKDGAEVKTRNAIKNETVDVDDMEIPERDGYIFRGWSRKQNDSEAISQVKADENMDFYAIWEEEKKPEDEQNENPEPEDPTVEEPEKPAEGEQEKPAAEEPENPAEDEQEKPAAEPENSSADGQENPSGSEQGAPTTEGQDNTTVVEPQNSTPSEQVNPPVVGPETPTTQNTTAEESHNPTPVEPLNPTMGEPENSTTVEPQPSTVVEPQNPTTSEQQNPTEAEQQNPTVSETQAQPSDELPPGGIIENGEATYSVSAEGSATATRTNNAKVKNVRIGNEVSYGGKTYKVTRISKGAYKNCKKLKSVRLGSNITKIGANAFKGCKRLGKITIRANNLKSVGRGSFKGIKEGAKFTIICRNKKTYGKVVKKLRRAGATTGSFKFKKG
ncbi:InlB B-repeat-containing protein [Butyrivibrio sp. AC2005]|uniref:InlB B-repeat-containing protein n=1 Tax=Butyrivibrio sp. AC2005 TaxID=1280672 RepID=UPI00041B77E6|nr:InlB B-repeat-containing protein [Butyrivibrio sp. AC2005]